MLRCPRSRRTQVSAFAKPKAHHEELVKCSLLALVAACAVALTLLGSGASAQRLHTHEHDHPDVVLERRDFGPARRAIGSDSTQEAGSAGIIATPDNQILVELLPRDTASANLFDLTGRTLLFTPDRHGGYSRSVQSVAWDDDIGRAVADGEEIWDCSLAARAPRQDRRALVARDGRAVPDGRHRAARRQPCPDGCRYAARLGDGPRQSPSWTSEAPSATRTATR